MTEVSFLRTIKIANFCSISEIIIITRQMSSSKRMDQNLCEGCGKVIKSDRYCCDECDSQFCGNCFDSLEKCSNCRKDKKHIKWEMRIMHLKDISLNNKNLLSEIKLIQNSLIYIIGLPQQIASEEALMKTEYLGQYGTIVKLIVKRNGSNHNSSSNAAYVTYQSDLEASLALLGTDEFQLYHSSIKASCGTTKYCSHFLKGTLCPKMKECVYLHAHPSRDTQILQKEDKMPSKWLSSHSLKMAKQTIRLNLKQVLQMKQRNHGKPSVFPSIAQILEQLIETQDIKEQQLSEIENSNYTQVLPNRVLNNARQDVKRDAVETIETRIIDICNFVPNQVNQKLGGSRFKFVQEDQNVDLENIKIVKEYAKSLQN